MRFSSALPTLFAFATLSLSVSARRTREVHPTSLAPGVTKRDLLGLCTLLGIGCDLANDINNCGARGHVCGGNWLNALGYTCQQGVCGATCKSLFDFNWDTRVCQNVASDTDNCGACGNVCSLTGASAAKCSSGTCLATACSSGYALSNGVCNVVINYATDPKNCGKAGNVCSSSWSNGSGATCEAGVCRATTCNALYDWDYSSKYCRPVGSDTANCGSCGNACSFPNGNGICSAGTCTLQSCQTSNGYYNVNGVCTSLNLQTDSNNCGALGKVCSFANGSGKCSAGVCTYTGCTTASYALVSNSCQKVNLLTDTNNCGKIGNICPSSFLNGNAGFCLLGVCQSICNNLFDFDLTFGFCRDVSSDTNNCGKCGSVCSVTGASQAKCSSGSCVAVTCTTGYTLTNGACVAIDTTSDPKNCGKVGNCCTFTPSGATGICSKGVCTTTTCPTGYTLSYGACVKTTASQRARLAKKDHLADKRTLCPAGETACPIVGSASYDLAVTHHFSASDEFSGVMAGAGGYECLDTTQSLDSCGGCASTGEGQDCTKIRGAVGVGCDAGSCVVFSCLAGWRPNLAGTRCVRAHTEHGANTSAPSGARRHLHARHGLSHHG